MSPYEHETVSGGAIAKARATIYSNPEAEYLGMMNTDESINGQVSSPMTQHTHEEFQQPDKT